MDRGGKRLSWVTRENIAGGKNKRENGIVSDIAPRGQSFSPKNFTFYSLLHFLYSSSSSFPPW
jgi:hypothetical protein